MGVGYAYVTRHICFYHHTNFISDWEDAYSPDQSSFIFGAAGENLTFNQFSDENNYVWDQRGYNRIILKEADRLMYEAKRARKACGGSGPFMLGVDQPAGQKVA